MKKLGAIVLLGLSFSGLLFARSAGRQRPELEIRYHDALASNAAYSDKKNEQQLGADGEEFPFQENPFVPFDVIKNGDYITLVDGKMTFVKLGREIPDFKGKEEIETVLTQSTLKKYKENISMLISFLMASLSRETKTVKPGQKVDLLDFSYNRNNAYRATTTVAISQLFDHLKQYAFEDMTPFFTINDEGNLHYVELVKDDKIKKISAAVKKFGRVDHSTAQNWLKEKRVEIGSKVAPDRTPEQKRVDTFVSGVVLAAEMSAKVAMAYLTLGFSANVNGKVAEVTDRYLWKTLSSLLAFLAGKAVQDQANIYSTALLSYSKQLTSGTASYLWPKKQGSDYAEYHVDRIAGVALIEKDFYYLLLPDRHQSSPEHD